MPGELEKLAYEAALRGLDKQENLLEELRARTGVLLAVSSLAASFLGQQAFRHPGSRGLALYFSMRGGGLFEGLYDVRYDKAGLYLRLAHDLDRFWDVNNERIRLLSRVYAIGAGALVIEVLSMVGVIGDILL
jgi:hypothetical protein